MGAMPRSIQSRYVLAGVGFRPESGNRPHRVKLSLAIHEVFDAVEASNCAAMAARVSGEKSRALKTFTWIVA
jgi:hypothetical protein